MKKMKTVLLCISLSLLVFASVIGTLSYLTDTEEVVNTFTVGNVDITLDEADVDELGAVISNDRVKENEYHLIPGGVYVKDPTVTVKKGSEASYIRMLVTISDMADIKAVLGDGFLPENYVEGYDKAVWKCVKITDNGDDTATYEFRYKDSVDKVSADKVLEPLFEKIKVPGEITGEELAQISEMKISVIGNAIQKTGFENEDAAWAAFDLQMN